MICFSTYSDFWRVTWYIAVDGYYRQQICDDLRRLGASASIVRRADGSMRRNALDTGFTYSSSREHHSIVVIGRTSSGAEFLNSYTHELRHLCDDIAGTMGLGLDGEAVAYLCGDIARATAHIVCHLTCDCCRDSAI